MKLFITGFVQVFFVAINTYFISKSYFIGVAACGFMISIIWTWNVKRIAFGNNTDRIIYATGAAFGSLAGAFISTIII